MKSRYGCIEAYLNHKVNPDTRKKKEFLQIKRALEKIMAAPA